MDSLDFEDDNREEQIFNVLNKKTPMQVAYQKLMELQEMMPDAVLMWEDLEKYAPDFIKALEDAEQYEILASFKNEGPLMIEKVNKNPNENG